MAKVLVKCPYCEKQFDRNDKNIPYVKIGRRYAHKECVEQHESSITQEERDLNSLYQYIKELLGVDYNFLKIKKQIEEYKKEYNYTYTGMLSSLKWFYEINHHSIEKANGGIGIIPYIYNDARKYYYNIYLAQQKNKDISDYKVQTKEITIQSPRMYIAPPKLWFEEDEE